LLMLIVGGLAVMMEPDEMERSSAKHDPLLVLTSLVTGFRMIHALTGELPRAQFVISWEAIQFRAEMLPPWPFLKLLSFPRMSKKIPVPLL